MSVVGAVVPVPPRRVLRVVLEPLLDRFVSYQEPKPLCCICVSCPLHIEVPERHSVRHGLRSAFFDRNEVELIVDAPVIRHRVRRAVFKHQLRAAHRFAADEHVGWRWRDERVRWQWRDVIPDRIRKWNEDAVSREYPGTRCEPQHDNHSSPLSYQWPWRGARLGEGRSIRNEQSEKRETNHAAHASPPRSGSLLGYGHVALGATIDGNDYGFVEPATRTSIPDQTQGCSWACFDPPGARSSSRS